MKLTFLSLSKSRNVLDLDAKSLILLKIQLKEQRIQFKNSAVQFYDNLLS